MGAKRDNLKIEFGQFQLDAQRRILTRNGERIALTPKSFDVLQCLADHAGELVTKEQILAEIWPDVSVEEGNLTYHIWVVRRALGESANAPEYIATVPGRGYRFIADIVEPAALPAPSLPATAISMKTHGHGRSGKRLLRSLWPATCIGLLSLLAWTLTSRGPAMNASSAVQLTHFGQAENVVTDGARLYITRRAGSQFSLVQAPVTGGDPALLPVLLANPRILDISPDRTRLLVSSSENANAEPSLWIAPLIGGAPQRLEVNGAQSAAWSPDGRRIAFTRGFEVGVIDADGLNQRKLAGMERAAREPGDLNWSPDGRVVRFSAVDPVNGGSSLWEVGADGSVLRPLLATGHSQTALWGEGQCCGRWTSGGDYFLYREAFFPRTGIWATPERANFRGNRGRPIEIYSSGMDLSGPVINRDGKRIFVIGHQESRELAWYNAKAEQFVPYAPAPSAALVRPSPDGKWAIYTSFPDRCLWRVSADGRQRIQLTFPPMQAFGGAWSPDASQIAFHALWPGKPGKICIVPADSGAVRVLLGDSSTAEDVPNWSPDGDRLMFGQNRWSATGENGRTVILDLRTNQLSVLPGSTAMGPPAWSPDGHYVAAQSGDFRKLMLFDFNTNAWTEIAQGGFINAPQWSHDGRSIVYQDLAKGEELPVYRISRQTWRQSKIADRSSFLRPDVSRFSLVALTPDDAPLVVIAHSTADVYGIDISLR